MGGPRTTLFLQTGPACLPTFQSMSPNHSTLVAKLPPAGLSARIIGLTYLFWMLWCVPSRPTFLVATGPGHKPPDQRP